MAPRTRAAIFIAIALAWLGLAAVSIVNGYWLVALVDVAVAGVMIAFGYRATHPRGATGTPVKPLRAPRPPR